MRLAIVIIFILALVMPVFAEYEEFEKGTSNIPAEPLLIYPVKEEAILEDDLIEFKWLNNYYDIRYFVFKIYKGYKMYQQGLIYKENVPANSSSVKVKTDIFEHGQVYTWSLFAVGSMGQTGDKSFNSFKAIKY